MTELKNLVRFDFPPGASPKDIAEAIQRARVKLVEEYARAKAATIPEQKTMTPQCEIPTSHLLRRGWTRTLISRLMPNADGRQSVDHWANFQGTPTYFALRVWEIEQSEEFGKAFLRTW